MKTHDWHARIRTALATGSSSPDENVVEELAQHARATYEAARAEGASDFDAEQRVMAIITRWRSESSGLGPRSHRTFAVPPPPAAPPSRWSGLAQDIRYSLRLIRRQPRFALLVIATMALGIAPTTALFSVTYGVLLKPLPWPDADRVVVLKEKRGGKDPRFGSFTNTAYHAWREQAATVDALAAWSPRAVTLTGAGDPERLRGTAVTASLFRVLGIQPVAGTLFQDADETRTPRVTILAENLWRRRFGGDLAIIGRPVQFDGESHTVVGIVADDAGFPDRRTQMWVPMSVSPVSGNSLSLFEALARLRPDATVEQAASEGTARGKFVANTGLTTTAIFGGDGPVEVSARPLRDALTGDVRRPLIILLSAVLLLLLIATTNIAGLQLARATTRRRELAIRAAIGAGTGRVMRQLVVECVLLGLIGGAAGFAGAWALNQWATSVLPADFPRSQDLTMNYRIVLFAIGVSIAVSLSFAILPARRIRRLNLVGTLAEDGASPAGIGRRSAVARSRLFLVAGQVAIACVLLVAASLFGRSFLALLHADRGFDASEVLTTTLTMAGAGFRPEQRIAILQTTIERLEAMPGIEHVGFTSETPTTPGGSTSAMTIPSPDGTGMMSVQAAPRLVSPGYFEALGLRLIAGRTLEDSDTATSQPVAVVNETLARRYLGRAPLEARVPLGVWGPGSDQLASVVGVVEDLKYVGGNATTTLPEMYFSYRQIRVGLRSSIATLLIRADRDPSAVTGALRTALRDVDTAAVPGIVMTLEDRLLASSLARPRLYAVLLMIFAGVALAVTGVGLFGVLSYTVAQRTRELALRAALGARRLDLIALVVRQGLGVAAAGVAIGLTVAAGLSRFTTTLLFGITAGDLVTYAAVPIILLGTAAAACFLPARRAARLDPLRGLRS